MFSLRVLPTAGVLVAAIALFALAPTTAPAKPRSCSGTVMFSKKATKVVIYRGVGCKTAKRILKQYATGLPDPPWRCAIAHAPFDKRDGRKIAVSCGYGEGRSNLRKKAHAFVATVK